MKEIKTLQWVANTYMPDWMKNEDGWVEITVTILDDVFMELQRNHREIKEIKVTPEQMNMIVRYLLANMPNSCCPHCGLTGEYLNLFKENKVDKFMGIKLHLSE